MKLINETKYDTRTLRSLVCAIHTFEANGGRGHRLRSWKRLTIRIAYAKKGNRRFTGHAYYHGGYSHLSVPRGTVSVQHLAALWRHELWHLYGIRHCDYPESILYCRVSAWTAQWEERFGATLSEVADEVVTTDDRKDARVADVEKKLLAAESRLKRWEAKSKRATTGIKSAKRDMKKLHRRLETTRTRPVEEFAKKAARPHEPKPVPEGHVRLDVTLSVEQGNEVDAIVGAHRESFDSYEGNHQAQWARIFAALDAGWVKRRGNGGRLVMDLLPEDAQEFIYDMGALGTEVSGWQSMLERAESSVWTGKKIPQAVVDRR